MTKLGIAMLYVRNLEGEKRFFQDMLGLSVDSEQSSPTFVMFQMNGEGLFALQDISGSPEYAGEKVGGFEVGLEVENVDETWSRWQNSRGKTLTEPQDLPFGRSFEAEDPEGHRLSIYRMASR